MPDKLPCKPMSTMVDNIEQELRGAKKSDVPFTMVVGSGFSFPLILTAAGMTDAIPKWLKRKTKARGKLADFRKKFWRRVGNEWRDNDKPRLTLTTKGVPDTASFDNLSHCYQAAMEYGFSSGTQRREFIRDQIKLIGQQINPATLLLASLLKAQDEDSWPFPCRFCRTIFTTNFDPLLQRGLQLVNKLYFMTDRPRTIEQPDDRDRDAIHLIYLHGSIHQYQIANTPQEITAAAEEQRDALSGYFKRKGIIVVGYSGWDDACMQALLGVQYFPRNLYWCDIHPPHEAADRLHPAVYAFLRDNKRSGAYYVQLDGGADGLMEQLHRKLTQASAPAFVEDPLTPMVDRLQSIVIGGSTAGLAATQAAGSDTIIKSGDRAADLAEVLQRTLQRLVPARLAFQHPKLVAIQERGETVATRKPAAAAAGVSRQDIENAVVGKLMNDAMHAYDKQDLSAAIEHWMAVVDTQGVSWDDKSAALYNCGVAYEELGEPKLSKKVYGRIVRSKRAPNAMKAKALYNRAVIYNGEGNHAKELEDYDAVISLEPPAEEERIKSHYNRGVVRKASENLDGAIEDFSIVIADKEAPVDIRSKALVNRGFSYVVAGDVKAALRDYRTAANLKDAHVDRRVVALGNLGWQLQEIGELAKSIEASRQALDLDPSQIWIRANLGLALLRDGHPRAARAAYKIALKQVDGVDVLERFIADDLNALAQRSPKLKGLNGILALAAARRQELQ